MAKGTTKYYWWCQICGWSVVGLSNLFFAHIFEQKVSTIYLERILTLITAGILSTHLLRAFIKKMHWLTLPIEKVLPKLIVAVIVTTLVLILFQMGVIHIFNLYENKRNLDFTTRLLANVLNVGIFTIPWTLIYYFYHYNSENRKQQFDTLKLESLVKELELKTIKSHINPHFIFNALNSIRALIDENPGRARTAITELSNILRSSMQAEKLETVSFEKELNIVKDYLALEHIRFEDRLRVEYDIDEDTLNQPIPPMMLQTLVENAIKHGISKQVNGGNVKIISDFKGDYHELVIQNTGYLNGSLYDDGFGITSTKTRLQLLFGVKANFNIKEVNSNTVEATILIPVELIK
jgi:two-component system, LytTR family, sensor kinase